MIKKLKNLIKYRTDNIVSINVHSKNSNQKMTRIENEIKEIKKNSIYQINRAKEEAIKKIKFSVVTACYNNEKYLDDYFEAFLKQKYINNIELIIIDDGSVDESAIKIKKWQNKNLMNIKYIYKENQGQAMARNLGIKYIRNDWCIFIDADDFISENFFFEIGKDISNREKPFDHVYVAKWKLYYEETKKYKNHYLNWRFEKENQKININTNPEYINLSASSVVFNSRLIKGYDLSFDKEIKPNFEDADFYLTYLEKCNIDEVVFMGKINYFYRKRKTENSTIDLSRQDFNRYNLLLNNGYLKLIEKNNSDKIKMTLLYDLRWNIESFVFLKNKTQKLINERNEKLKKIFSHIEIKDIKYAFDKNLISKYFEEYLLRTYYDISGTYIHQYQYMYQTREKIIVKIVCSEEVFNKIEIEKKIKIKKNENRSKVIYNIDNFFINEYQIYIDKKKFNVAKIFLNKQEKWLTKINENYKDKYFSKNSILLFFDRKDKADDNGEAFYRYFQKNKTEYVNIYFVLEKKSPDWNRLKKDGFNLIDYGSEKFMKLYEVGDFIFSSAGDSQSIENFNRYRYFWYKSNIKFIFLQHGIIKDNLSDWLMSKRFDKIIATGKKEKKYLIDNVFPKEKIIFSGLPRYDYLLENNKKEKKKIVLSFTWRNDLKDISKEKFKENEYYKKIKSLLERLDSNVDHEMILIGHPNTNTLIDLLNKENLKNITIKNSKDISYKKIIPETLIFITDFSSLAFDMALVGAKIIYYQFNKELFYSNHTYKECKELFSYENDGFGPVVVDEKEVIQNIQEGISGILGEFKYYKNRKDKFFINIKPNSCEILFNYILNEYKKR